jgi:hypothetical protein
MNQPTTTDTVLKPSTKNLRMPAGQYGVTAPTPESRMTRLPMPMFGSGAVRPEGSAPIVNPTPIDPSILDLDGITNALADLLGGLGDGPEYEGARGAVSTLQGLFLNSPQPTIREVDPGPRVQAPGIASRQGPSDAAAAFYEDDLNRREAIALALGRRLGRVL